tara:strand:+ start:229 stop:435 length:207 start_codon:yes stop_codon:yes gene_type:complete
MARKIWYKFRKWLKYNPEKHYMRGKSDQNSNGNDNNVDAKLAISTISRISISRHGDMRVIQSNDDRGI